MSMAVDNIARAMAASALQGGGGGSSATGMPLVVADGEEVEVDLLANQACMCIDQPTSIDVMLDFTEAQDETYLEWVLTFVAGTDCYLTVTAPQGFQLVYPDGTPNLTAGKLYEFSFAADAGRNLVGLYKEIDINYE